MSTTTTPHDLSAPLFAAPDPASVTMPAWAESVDAFTWVGLPDVWRRCVTRRTGPRVHLWSWQDVAADGSMTSDPPRIDVEDTVIETPQDARELAWTILAAADALGGEAASTDRHDLSGLAATLAEDGRRFVASTGDRKAWATFGAWSPDRHARLENDVKMSRGQSATVPMQMLGVLPPKRDDDAHSLIVGWSQGSVEVPLTPGECLNLAAQLVRAATLASA